MISRRSFIALASGLLIPEPEPVRAYSFVGGWALPRWYPILFGGLPVFKGAAPLAMWGLEPAEFESAPDSRFRVGTHAEVERFELLSRDRRKTGGLVYSCG